MRWGIYWRFVYSGFLYLVLHFGFLAGIWVCTSSNCRFEIEFLPFINGAKIEYAKLGKV